MALFKRDSSFGRNGFEFAKTACVIQTVRNIRSWGFPELSSDVYLSFFLP